MKTFKVYMRLNGKLTDAFFSADDISSVTWKVLSRFPFASICKVVEL